MYFLILICVFNNKKNIDPEEWVNIWFMNVLSDYNIVS